MILISSDLSIFTIFCFVSKVGCEILVQWKSLRTHVPKKQTLCFPWWLEDDCSRCWSIWALKECLSLDIAPWDLVYQLETLMIFHLHLSKRVERAQCSTVHVDWRCQVLPLPSIKFICSWDVLCSTWIHGKCFALQHGVSIWSMCFLFLLKGRSFTSVIPDGSQFSFQ